MQSEKSIEKLRKQNHELSQKIGDDIQRETELNTLAQENISLRKSMGNFDDWINQYNQLKDDLSKAVVEIKRLRDN